MAALDVTSYDAALKEQFPAKRMQFLGYKNNPLLALVPKNPNFGGDTMKIPLWYGGNQGASRTFATAQTNKSAGLYKAFQLTRKKDYGLTSIELEAILASMSDAHAFMRASTGEIENIVRTVGRNLALSLYRNSGGARGVVGSTSTTALTLATTADVVNFDIDMHLDSSTTDGTSGAADGDDIKITAIDRLDGVLTGASNWTGSGNFSDNDYVFRTGDFGNSIAGLDAWVPSADPTATLFFGVDRSSDVTRLGGLRYNGASETLEEALQSAEILVSREGGTPSHVFMHHDDYGDLRKSLGSRVVFGLSKSPDVAEIGFQTIVLHGSYGEVQVVPDRNCPKGVAYMLQLDSWVFASLGPSPRILQGMGNQFIWDSNADSIEARVGYYGNLACYAPGFNCRITLPS